MRRYPFAGEIGFDEIVMTGFEMCARQRERERLGDGRERERSISEETERDVFSNSGRDSVSFAPLITFC